ncbi:FAD-binding and (Fe-S)-binding domain-containing protein [Microvirga puerhi]|uniref:FAD-binding oxidoreductase n=1 Tax=Microvirga puerhi TaxID=2876078 RepID=A0ABS7VJD2_9HYPH|nr:FAD-binding and (Fe-S)-binding domain-containing protein [Microvirga puerhi]MBZ6075620.1 FAD-binding oxidoreductase [Microvirga puerhi]
MANVAVTEANELSSENRKRHPERRIERAPGGRIRTVYTDVPGLDPKALFRELEAAVDGEVRFDDGSRALYATDSSNYRQVPIGVVLPRTREAVVKTLEICRRHHAPILPRGGGTSLAGECCNTAVVIDFSKYLNRVLEIDPERHLARVEPGCILDHLRDEAAKYGLTFGPDPATHDHNTLGGMIGNDSGGVHAVMNGITVHNVYALEILTYEGLQLKVGPTDDEAFRSILRAGGRRAEIYRRLDELRRQYGDLIRQKYPEIPRRVSGYENLDQLLPEKDMNVARALVGTEGTCVIVLEATLNLIHNPPARVITIVGFPDIFQAADAVPNVLKYQPIGLEGFDETLIDRYKTKGLHTDDLKVLPQGKGWLLVEFGGENDDDAVAKAQKFVDSFKGSDGVDPKLIQDKDQQKRIWNVRDDSLGAESYVPNHPDTWPGWEDSAVSPDQLGDYLRELKTLFAKYGYDPVIYGHFAGGVVHCAIAFELYDEPGIERWREFLDEAAELVVRHDGSLSGEHGDGQARGALLEKMYGPDLVRAFREFKAIWDPQWLMNPGKVIDPYPITSNLRLGPSYHPRKLETYFTFPNEGGFERAAQRCVGVGKCRRHNSDGEVMCPSYLATHEEKYTTRGRARLLFEMLHGGPINNGWRSNAVEDALSLCLACKGCKSDCPVSVDMASYKAEFRAHHYAWRLRPRHAYAMGWIYWLAREASRMPRTANLLTQTPVLRGLAKAAGGIAQQRSIPRFAPEPFTDWFRRREAPRNGGRRVLLWPDTFNNYFRPATAIAATKILEELGFQVVIPDRPLCCGRPLYDWGWLGTAKRLWRQTMTVLGEEIRAGTPLIGLEPACLTSFKDELINFYPEDEIAKRLSEQSVFFSDFMDQHADGRTLQPDSHAKALVQIHCHQHAVIKDGGERRLLDRLNLDYDIMRSGCCGMAGAFGFSAKTYDVAMAAGERVLLPTVRSAEPETLILANGYSCREQIEQGAGKETLHVAELMARRLGL